MIVKKVILSGHTIVREADLSRVRQALPEHIRLTYAEPGCIIFIVVENETELGRFDVYEEFESKEAFEAHQHRMKMSDWGAVTKRVERFYTIQEMEFPNFAD